MSVVPWDVSHLPLLFRKKIIQTAAGNVKEKPKKRHGLRFVPPFPRSSFFLYTYQTHNESIDFEKNIVSKSLSKYDLLKCVSQHAHTRRIISPPQKKHQIWNEVDQSESILFQTV